MTIATGVNKQVRYKIETTWGTAPATTAATVLRRVSSDLNLTKDSYESAEIRTDYQVADFRHGVRKVGGTIRGEFSPATYAPFIASALRKAWAATADITSVTLTIAASGSYYTVTRSAGDFLADGVKVGDTIRITAGSFTAGNMNNNLCVLALTATVATVTPLNGSSLTAEGPIASATIDITGKRTYVPTSSHTDESYYIEHWHSDVSRSQQFSGCKVNSIAMNLPATGLATIDLGFMGKEMTNGTAAFYSSPTAANSNGLFAAVNGVLRVGSTKVANVTGLSINIDNGMSSEPVVGSNTVPDISEGRVRVSGQLTAKFEDATYLDMFDDETEGSLSVWLASDNTAASKFVGITLPRIKMNGASIDDGEKGLIQTIPFVALYNSTGGSGVASEQTTIVVQDSDAP